MFLLAVVTAFSMILANDNRIPAGTLDHGELHVSLDARWGMWYPDSPAHEGVAMQAFAEAGKPLEDPGPLIRVPVGSEIIMRMRNSVPGTVLTIHGLVDRPSDQDRPVSIPYGSERIIRFRAGAAGTFDYWATTSGVASFAARTKWDSQLGGAIVVDPPGSDERKPDDRVFVISTWLNVYDSSNNPVFRYDLHVINGRAWPYTERLSYDAGSIVRWRVVDLSAGGHPMHLHGFYFRVTSRGDGIGEVDYPLADQISEVTELIRPHGTFEMAWTATRPGNWLFHCHIPAHAIAHQPIDAMLAGKSTMSAVDFADGYVRTAAMGGLVLEVTVRGVPRITERVEPANVRHLKLLVQPSTASSGPDPAFKYVLDDGATTSTESGLIGPPIILRQDQPVSIDIVNELNEATSVHWHGMELTDSYYDGAAGISGDSLHVAPMIEPGATFNVRFTPPRSGTFIYHTHMHDQWQMRGGLAGPLIVLPPGMTYDPATDHVIMISTSNDASKILSQAFINGEPSPAPLVLHAGMPQRLRLINMTVAFFTSVVSLVSPTGPVTWRPIAVDGYDLAPALRNPEEASQILTIGKTLDFTYTPNRPGDLTFVVRSFRGGPIIARMPVEVLP
jgi:FtsP/CotA-like multicopper oxidase with cupredoxin domain